MTREQERQELYKTIWSIANDLRGSVDGWDFKAYVLGMLAYRYLSESLAGELNRGEREAGAADFDYARQDECLEGQDRLNFVQNRGYYIESGLLFENVMQRGEDELNIYLDKALRQIEASGEGTGAAKMFEGLFTDMDLNSNKLGASKYFVPSTNSNKLSEQNIQDIMKTLLDRKDVDHVAKLADKDMIREQEYNLSVSMYVEKEVTSEKIDIDALEVDIDATVKREAALRQDIDGIVSMLRQGRNGGGVV